jgi:hypothetical protein
VFASFASPFNKITIYKKEGISYNQWRRCYILQGSCGCRVKEMMGPAPHTQLDADIASGMGMPDNGPKLS